MRAIRFQVPEPVLGTPQAAKRPTHLQPLRPGSSGCSVQGGSLRACLAPSAACRAGAEGGLTTTTTVPSLPTAHKLAALLVPSKHRGSGCAAVFRWSDCWLDRPSSGSCRSVSQRCFTPQRLRRWPRVPATLLLRRTEQGVATVAVTSVSVAYCGSLRALLPLDPDRRYLDLCPDPLWLLPDPQS